MKFIFIAPRFHTNQTTIVKSLISNKHIVEFWVVKKGFSESYKDILPNILDPSIWVLLIQKIFPNLKNFPSKYFIPNLFKTIRKIKASQADIFIIRNPQYIFSIIFIILCKLFRKKILLYSQKPYYFKKYTIHYLYILFLNSVFRTAWFTPIIGIPGHTNKVYRSFFLPTVFLNNDNNIKSFGGAIKILSIGKFESRKNHLLLIECFSEVLKYAEAYLTIIGENTSCTRNSYYSSVCNLINEKELQNYVKVITNIDYQKIMDIYAANDLFVLPSINEPFSFSVIEAMSFGLPVLCTNTCGTKYYVLENNSGYVVEGNNRESLIRQILKLMHDKKKLEQLSVNCFTTKNKYNSEYFNDILNNYIQVYNLK